MKKHAVVFFQTLLQLSLVGLFATTCRGPDLSRYNSLKDPAISAKPAMMVLQARAMGEPKESISKTLKSIFSVYYKIDSKYRVEGAAPIVRWPVSPGTPRAEWIAVAGMQVGDGLSELPPAAAEANPPVTLEHWDYGEVAEILYIGPYDREEPTITRLHNFIKDRGYEIAGAHEEEYIKGPGMFFAGNPEDYRTIIRYPVKKGDMKPTKK